MSKFEFKTQGDAALSLSLGSHNTEYVATPIKIIYFL